MTATDVRSIIRDTIAESILRYSFFFGALVSGFVTFPAAKFFVGFCLLFVASIGDAIVSALKLQSIQQKRFLWMLELGNRIGITNLHNKGEFGSDGYVDADDFWRECQREAVEDIKSEDGVALAGEELDADFNPLLKTRIVWNILGYLLFDLVIVAIALFAAKFIANV